MHVETCGFCSWFYHGELLWLVWLLFYNKNATRIEQYKGCLHEDSIKKLKMNFHGLCVSESGGLLLKMSGFNPA